MPRKRRSAEEAKSMILEAAQNLLLEKGPEALKIAHIAKKAQISHPLILHHFGSAEGVLFALQEAIARDIRTQLLDTMRSIPLNQGISQALTALSSPKQARLMAWLIVRGRSPFPPAEEKGLIKIQHVLHEKTGRSKEELNNMILLILFAMYGEAMFGKDLRERLGVEHTSQTQQMFQQWLLSLFSA